MDVIILTGMSGAGKSQAAHFLEDQGYFCIDNLPPMVLPELVRTFLKGQGGEGFAIDKLAFVVDIRSNDFLKGFGKAMTELKNLECPYRIIFLEANDQVLVSRYRQTRRKHPLSDGLSLVEAIEKERSQMRGIRARATHVIDTSLIALSALKEELLHIIEISDEKTMDIHVESFGFKYGLPGDCDITCDVRFLPNPFYIPELKMHCGKDQEIIEFLEKHPETEQYYYFRALGFSEEAVLSLVNPFEGLDILKTEPKEQGTALDSLLSAVSGLRAAENTLGVPFLKSRDNLNLIMWNPDKAGQCREILKNVRCCLEAARPLVTVSPQHIQSVRELADELDFAVRKFSGGGLRDGRRQNHGGKPGAGNAKKFKNGKGRKMPV